MWGLVAATSKMRTDIRLLLVTPTYARPQRLKLLKRCVKDFRDVPNLLWLVVEDDSGLDREVNRLLVASGISHIYMAHGPTRHWGNAQRNRALQYICDQRLDGIVYFADDDNKYQRPLFNELRKVRRIGILPVGCLGPTGIERPIVRDGRIISWDADWQSRKYPIDTAGFAFNAKLLFDVIGDLWPYQSGSRGGETEFIESLINSPDELECLCNDCRDCYVWHDLPLGWPARVGRVAYVAYRRAPPSTRQRYYRLLGKLVDNVPDYPAPD